jgi:hypothetical protein
MELYFIEDRQKITDGVTLAFEQRQSGRERIGLLRSVLKVRLLAPIYTI